MLDRAEMQPEPGMDRTPLALPRLPRAEGRLHVAFKRRDEQTVLDTLYQQGCLKARFPALEPAKMREGVVINTAGGLTDGDRLDQRIDWGAGTTARMTAQAAERIYRSRGGAAEIDTRLTLGKGATAHWLAQETILFDGGRLVRRNSVDMADDSRLLATESVVFGRRAREERVLSGRFFESWRIRMDGKLVFADGLRLDDDIDAQLAHAAIGDRAAALATLIYAGADAAALEQAMKEAAGQVSRDGARAAASLLPSVLVARVLAPDGASMRRALMNLAKTAMNGAASGPDAGAGGPVHDLPRVWFC